MKFENGFVQWDDAEEEALFMNTCAPHECKSLEVNQFSSWLKGVIQAHLDDGGEKLLYAAFLSGVLSQLPLETAISDGQNHLALTGSVMSDARSSSYELSRTRQVGNASFLH